jgi:hypothetical protein
VLFKNAGAVAFQFLTNEPELNQIIKDILLEGALSCEKMIKACGIDNLFRHVLVSHHVALATP